MRQVRWHEDPQGVHTAEAHGCVLAIGQDAGAFIALATLLDNRWRYQDNATLAFVKELLKSPREGDPNGG